MYSIWLLTRRSFCLWVLTCKDVYQQVNIVGMKIVADIKLEPATFGLPTYRFPQLSYVGWYEEWD